MQVMFVVSSTTVQIPAFGGFGLGVVVVGGGSVVVVVEVVVGSVVVVVGVVVVLGVVVVVGSVVVVLGVVEVVVVFAAAGGSVGSSNQETGSPLAQPAEKTRKQMVAITAKRIFVIKVSIHTRDTI